MDNKGQKPSAELPTSPNPKDFGRLADEMKRLVDVIEASAGNFAGLYVDGQERKQESQERSAREAILSAEKSARLQNAKMRHAVIALAASIVISAVGFILNSYSEARRHEREDERVELQRKLEKFELITRAITDLRKVKDEALIDCGTQLYDSRVVEHKRLEAQANLVKANRLVDFYFGQDFHNKIYEFMVWQNQFKDFCSKDLPPDSVWRKKHLEIDDLGRTYFPESTFKHVKGL